VVHADVFTGPGGKSRGCGIVEFATTSEAAAAIRDQNDTMLEGRLTWVREDRDA